MRTLSLSDLSRRQLLVAAGAGAAAGALTHFGARSATAAPEKIILGSGKHKYEWVSGWGKLPDGMSFGNTHGCIVMDSKKRIFMNTDTDNAVIIFDGNGKFVKAWGPEFKGGLHGMHIFKEGGKELMYLAHTGRHEVVKATLDGQVLMTLPFPDKAGVYKTPDEYKPTSIAVAPNGNVYVGDGYGKSWVHQYSPKGEYVRSWGGVGSDPGQMKTPHGLWVDTRGKTPVLIECDRGNHRLQIFDLDGKLLNVVTGMLESPCHAHQRGDDLLIADLKGRVTILDKDNKLITHLGENPEPKRRGRNDVKLDEWKDGEFLSPHCAKWDDKGNIYVLDWNFLGRIIKLKKVS